MTTHAHPFPRVLAPRKIVLHKWYLIAGLGLIALLVGTIHSREIERVRIQAANPAVENIETSVSAVGTVVPINDFPARANFSGMVQKVYVRLGQKIAAGQMLVDLKDQYAYSRIANAKAALESAEVNKENVRMSGSQEDRIAFASDLLKARTEQNAAASALATLKQLAANGSVSDAEVSAGAQRLQAANATLNALMERATARYSKTDIASWNTRVEAEKAALLAENVSYANAHVKSPISGTVYELAVAPYDFVPAGGDLLRVADLSRLRIHADFYELDVPKLRVGQPVRITWDGNAHRSWPGRVVEVPLAVTGDGLRRTGRATIELDDQSGDLPINTSVTATVITARHEHVITVPREALHLDNGSYYVYRVIGGQLIRTPVEVGLINPSRAEVTKGLEPTDEIALHAIDDQKLKDNLRVRTDR